MNLDEALASKPTTNAPKPVNLLSGVHDGRHGSGGDGDGPLGSAKVKTPETGFFGAGDRELDLKLDEPRQPQFNPQSPIVPEAALAPSQIPDQGPASDPFANAGVTGPFDVDQPAAALLDTFAPDMGDLSRTGLPMSGVDIPDERAIRELLRKILRRL